MRPKAWLLLALAQGLTLVALLTRQGDLLVLALPLLAYVLVGLLLAPAELKLEAQRKISHGSVASEERVEVALSLRNQGRHRLHLRLEDRPVHGDAADLPVTHLITLAAGEEREIKYSFQATRGFLEWQRLRVQAMDPLGLFILEQGIHAPANIMVRPRVLDLRTVPLPRRASRIAAGTIAANRAGSGVEYLGVREYAAGDSRRRMNWQLTARHPGRLFTNEFEAEQIADIGLVLDARQLSRHQVMEEELFERRVEAAASLCEQYIKNGNRVALLVFGKSMRVVFPGAGKQHSERVIRRLAGANLNGYVPFEYLEYYLTSRLFSKRSQIISLSALDARDLPTYTSLRARGFDVLLISPNSVVHQAKRMRATELNKLALRAARVERIKLLQQLKKFGVGVIDWDVHQPLETAAVKGMRLNRRRIRGVVGGLA